MGNEEATPNDATIEIMFDEARQGQAFISHWADAIDAKILTVFGGASVLIGAIPAIGGVRAEGWGWTPWVVAGIAWAVTSAFCGIAYGTRIFTISPAPTKLLDKRWTDISPTWVSLLPHQGYGRGLGQQHDGD